MNKRSAFPATIRSYHFPSDDEAVAKEAFNALSPPSRRNFAELQRLFAVEIGRPKFHFGYSRAAAMGRWMFFAHTGDTDEVIGYAACLPLESFGQIHGLITDLAVLPEYRHQGVAQSLISGISTLLGECRDQRISALAAIVPARRQEALDTFTIGGFETLVKGEEYLFRLSLNRASAQS